MRPDPATSLNTRRLAVVAALRAVQDERAPAPVQDIRIDAARAEIARVEMSQRAELVALQAELRRVVGRLERVEDSIELLRDSEEAPLAWPVPVTTDSPLEVPPLEVSRKSSPAFDILLGPAPSQATRDRDRDSA